MPVHQPQRGFRSIFARWRPGWELRVGVDLEKVEARTETFVLDYFTPAEKHLVDKFPADARAMLVTLNLEREGIHAEKRWVWARA